MQLKFEAVSEDEPGPRFAALFARHWPQYEQWFLSEGDAARPTYLECEEALLAHLPSLVPTWSRLLEASGGGDLRARFLSLWRPPPYISGCSQAVWVDDEPVLVRNYDYHPRLCEAVVLRSRWAGRTVVALTDCLIGVLDGMNDAGLCVSLSFGGRREVAAGFGAPLLLRHVLESCETAGQAAAELMRVPTHMAYNLLVLDRQGDFLTVFTRAGGPAVARRVPVTTNHQGSVVWPRHASATATLEREEHLLGLLSDPLMTAAGFVDAFLAPPLHSRGYARGFGTLYTTVYRPLRGEVDLLWPDTSWRQSLHAFEEGLRAVSLPDGDDV